MIQCKMQSTSLSLHIHIYKYKHKVSNGEKTKINKLKEPRDFISSYDVFFLFLFIYLFD